MTTYQIAFLTALYVAIQGIAYLEHRRNKNPHVVFSYEWYALAYSVNVFLIACILFYVFFLLWS